MGILNLTGFVALDRANRIIAALIVAITAFPIAGYIGLWFYWKGRNWARLLVLLCSVAALLGLLNLLHPHRNVLLYNSLIIANAVLGIFLLYWLNKADVREWFKASKP